MDEVRLSSTTRSADWINTEYRNENSPGTFLTVGTVQNFGGAPTITSFTGNPSSVGSGSTSTLSWSVGGANSLSIDWYYNAHDYFFVMGFVH
jgi:hypothetical protein